MKHVIISAVAVCTTILLSACGPATIGGEFTEPAYGWQRNGTYILTPAEMEMGCDTCGLSRAKPPKRSPTWTPCAVRSSGQSLVITGVAAMFGMVRPAETWALRSRKRRTNCAKVLLTPSTSASRKNWAVRRTDHRWHWSPMPSATFASSSAWPQSGPLKPRRRAPPDPRQSFQPERQRR